MLVNSEVAEKLVASQEELSSIESIGQLDERSGRGLIKALSGVRITEK
jgi:hypothetical protein